jgi:hypothetical protein
MICVKIFYLGIRSVRLWNWGRTLLRRRVKIVLDFWEYIAEETRSPPIRAVAEVLRHCPASILLLLRGEARFEGHYFRLVDEAVVDPHFNVVFGRNANPPGVHRSAASGRSKQSNFFRKVSRVQQNDLPAAFIIGKWSAKVVYLGIHSVRLLNWGRTLLR